MGNLVCVGAQWGDEGKGKIVDLLSASADVVVRFQGGNNAGHTLVVDGIRTVLHLVPSGILHPDKLCVIGSGTVIDPEVMIQEIEGLETRGLLNGPGRLAISERAHVILPFHKRIDKAREAARGGAKIGTTGRGIGPAYEDKAGRQGMRMFDLIDPQRAGQMVRAGVMHANSLLEAVDAEPFTGKELEEMIARVRAHGERLKPFVTDVGERVIEAIEKGQKVLFEGAQGAMLDLDHGTYPYVTSSNCLSGQAAVGTGIGPRYLENVMAVTKAYCTRVGEGPFPTELTDATGERLRSGGQEFGATTGRPRRCGWLDLAQLRYALRLNGATHLAITKLDVLAGLPSLKVCVGYELDGVAVRGMPAAAEDLARVTPVYEELAGFDSIPDDVKSLDDLPENARAYLDYILKYLGIPLAILSLGPGRGQELILENPLKA